MLNVNESATSIKPCYKMLRFVPEIWRYAESPYLCSVFFIVLDLRLTKDWLSGIDSIFLCPLKCCKLMLELKISNSFILNPLCSA